MILRDLTHSFRRLRAHPTIATVAILSLALGIGANTAVFSVIYPSLLRPLPYPDSDRRVILMTTNLNSPNRSNRSGATTADFLDWRTNSKTLEGWHMFGYAGTFTATGAGLPERVTYQHVTPGLLDSLGVRPVIGRLFRPGEEGERPALISELYWQRRFGGAEDVLGRKLTVGGEVHTVIGVVPGDFELFDEPGRVDFWNTINLSSTNWIQRQIPWLMAAAKLKPGVSLEQVQSELSGIAAGLATTYPDTNRHRGVVVTPMHQARHGGLGTVFYPLFGAVGFVLLIACVNVSSLLLARAVARRREFSLRAALGAGRGRLLRELFADGIALAGPGVALGLAFAYSGIALFRLSAQQGFPQAGSIELNRAALLFTISAGLAAGLLSAIFPALVGSKTNLTESLKEGARGSGGRARSRLRSSMVAVQIALALILLVAAGLSINTVVRMESHNLGFDLSNVTVAQLHLDNKRYNVPAPKREIDMRFVEPATGRFVEHVLAKTRSLPGVESAALAANVPMGPASSPGVQFRMPGDAAEERKNAQLNAVTAQFFETLRIPLRRGRYLNDRDVASAPWAVVVNETFAREFFPGREALGQTIVLIAGPEERPREIVGVVADFTQYTPRMPVRSEIYTSYFQQTREIPGNYQGLRFRPKLLVRAQVQPSPETISRIVASFDPELAVFEVRTLERYAAMRGVQYRFYANMLGLFSGIALVLAIGGIYGLMNYSVTDRFHEIGIRLTMGASPGRVVGLIMAEGAKLAVAGLVMGVAGALAATRSIEWMLFGVRPWDPLTFAAVSLFLLMVSVAACLMPALRAARIDPVSALRRD